MTTGNNPRFYTVCQYLPNWVFHSVVFSMLMLASNAEQITVNTPVISNPIPATIFFIPVNLRRFKLGSCVYGRSPFRGIPLKKHRRKTNPFRATASSSSVGISTDMPSSSSLHLPKSDPFCGRRV
ncbi:MAG: hypothetical protein IJO10_06240 [Clostridia bacterium]|nr:hypothetical protein [Clostridia bacterium]